MSADLGASNGLYIGTPDFTSSADSAPPADGVATYVFEVPSEGTYRLAFRVITATDSDSFWVRILGMVTNTSNHASGWVQFNNIQASDSWRWNLVYSTDDADQVADFTLATGTHTLEIARREDGTLLDAIAVLH